MNLRIHVPFLLSALILLFIFSGCAPVTFNRYQTADTLGKGNYKILAAANVAHDVSTPETFELDQEMWDELDDWGDKHPGNDSEILDITGTDFLTDLVWFASSGAGVSPDVELIFAAGVHDKVDLEARITGTLYARLNTKVKLVDFGKRGALAIGPGIGYRPINSGDNDSHGGTDYTSKYKGWVFSGEVPLIVGWQFKYASPYLAISYYYNHLSVDYTIESEDTSPNLSVTTQNQFDLHSGGLIAGVQFKFGKFVLTPELAAVYTQHSEVNYGFVYPGLALGASW